jgi:DNA-binding SARP family transcriptional activator
MLGDMKEEETALGALSRELIAAKAYAEGDAARARTAYNRLKFDAAAPQGVDPPRLRLRSPQSRSRQKQLARQPPLKRLPLPSASETTEETGQ